MACMYNCGSWSRPCLVPVYYYIYDKVVFSLMFSKPGANGCVHCSGLCVQAHTSPPIQFIATDTTRLFESHYSTNWAYVHFTFGLKYAFNGTHVDRELQIRDCSSVSLAGRLRSETAPLSLWQGASDQRLQHFSPRCSAVCHWLWSPDIFFPPFPSPWTCIGSFLVLIRLRSKVLALYRE